MPPKSIMKATRKAKSKEKSRVASSEGERRPAISKGTGVDDSVECSVCCQAIVEGKDEALFCEGECKRWMHRYCAGIPVSYFQSYGASESLFYCYTCCYRNHAGEIASLKETVNSLVTEVSSLRQRITEDHRDGLPATEDVSPLSEAASSSAWRQIAGADAGRSRVGQHRGGRRVGGGRGGKGGRGKGGAGGGAGGLGEDLSSSVGVQHHSRIHEPLPAKYPLKGARKVWGTLKTTTTVAVTNALKLVPDISPGSITVKRKYKTLNGTGRVVTKWWFILRGEEEVLQALENKWNIIAVQTAWRIEPVFFMAALPATPRAMLLRLPLLTTWLMITALTQKPVVALQTTPPVLHVAHNQ